MICTPISGVLADKYSRIKLLYITDFIRGIVVVGSAIVIYLNLSVFFTLLILYVTGVILNISGSIFAPASMAIVPELVEEDELLKANSFMSMIQQFSSIIGVMAGGIIYGIVGPFGIFVINAVSYILSGIAELFIIPLSKKVISNIEHDLTLYFQSIFKSICIQSFYYRGRFKHRWNNWCHSINNV